VGLLKGVCGITPTEDWSRVLHTVYVSRVVVRSQLSQEEGFFFPLIFGGHAIFCRATITCERLR
jgi:hypothetical protein